MVLIPVRRSLVPSPLESDKFEDFVTQYLNKCDDLLSYTQRYPTTKQTQHLSVQRQNRNPHEAHRWLRRNVQLPADYDTVKQILFSNRAEHLPRWMPHLQQAERIECLVPNLCEVFRYAYKSPGLKAKRDYCQLVIMRELIGDCARPKPRVFTASTSVTNLASLRLRSAHQSTTDLGSNTLKTVRSMADVNRFAGLENEHESYLDQELTNKPVRRFQVVSVPLLHKSCTQQRGYVRAVYESYEEISEFADGRVQWVSIYHSDFSGWIPSFVSDKSVASQFPREAQALIDYLPK